MALLGINGINGAGDLPELKKVLTEISGKVDIKFPKTEKQDSDPVSKMQQKLQSLISQSKLSDLKDADEMNNFLDNIEDYGFEKVDLIQDKNGNVIDPEKQMPKFKIYKNRETGERIRIQDSTWAKEKTIIYKKGNITHAVKFFEGENGEVAGKPYSGSVSVKHADGMTTVYDYKYNKNGNEQLDGWKLYDQNDKEVEFPHY